MMYCNSTDMITRFGSAELIQRTDRSNAGVIDYAVLEQAIDDATAEINAYLVAFTLPADSMVLVQVCCDIARYRLYDDMRMYESGQAVSQVAIRYERWISYLKEVATGKISLSPTSDGTAAETNNLPAMQSGSLIFARLRQ